MAQVSAEIFNKSFYCIPQTSIYPEFTQLIFPDYNMDFSSFTELPPLSHCFRTASGATCMGTVPEATCSRTVAVVTCLGAVPEATCLRTVPEATGLRVVPGDTVFSVSAPIYAVRIASARMVVIRAACVIVHL